MSSARSWSDTRLWRSIEKDIVELPINSVMSALSSAERTLRSSGTAPLDFTLHDDDHSYRVAERVSQLINDNVDRTLTPLESCVMLMACYMHDIGMSPLREKTRNLHQYVLTGDTSLVSNSDVIELQGWLDKYWDGVVPPIAQGAMTSGNLATSEKIIAYYTRHKHNDWSEQWIRDNLGTINPSFYNGWIDDVITLCRSHHEGITELRKEKFSPRLVAGGQVLNLRYLAALLRLADVTEFDPERTPDIILNHRGIAPDSKIYWQRDHEISFLLNPHDHSAWVSARPPNAVLHRAVLDIVEMVNAELSCCSILEHEGRYRLGTVPKGELERYRWDWPSKLIVDITEKNSSYVFIDGAFRPNVERVLGLLSGVSLYGSALAAVRELIQNASDAVFEQLAYERLAHSEPGDEQYSDRLASLHHIRISFEVDDKTLWLSCADDGVGMTREIIENHLLISGSPKRSELHSLERSATAHGFSVGRTGQFGIGALSYFMIADELVVQTRRGLEAGDPDSTAWTFKTDGVSSFGELTTTSRSVRGTDIRLRIKPGVFASDRDAIDQITSYIRHVVVHAPCPITITDRTQPSEPISIEKGWSVKLEAINDSVADGIVDESIDELLTIEREETRRRNNQYLREIRHDVTSSVSTGHTKEIYDDKNDLRIRLHRPVFEIDGTRSLAYVKTQPDGGVLPFPDGSTAYVPPMKRVTAWRGFIVSSFESGRRSKIVQPYIELNVRKGASIAVDRRKLEFDDLEINRIVSRHVRSFINELGAKLGPGRFDWLNRRLLDQFRSVGPAAVDVEAGHHWLVRASDGSYRWDEIVFPAYQFQLSDSYRRYLPDQIRSISGHLMMETTDVSLLGGHDISFFASANGGDIELLELHGTRTPVLVWHHGAYQRDNVGAAFPLSLDMIDVLLTPEAIVLNRNSKIWKGISVDQFADSFRRMRVSEIEGIQTDSIMKRADAAALVLKIGLEGTTKWRALCDRFPDVMNLALSSCSPGSDSTMRIWSHRATVGSSNQVVVHSADKVEIHPVDYDEGRVGLRVSQTEIVPWPQSS